MKRVWCCVKPHRLELVKSAIAALGVSGLTVADVRGVGASPEPSAWGDDPNVVALPVRSKIEAIVSDELVEEVIAAILDAVGNSEPGDGKIFVEPMIDALRIRTGERGEGAI